MDIVIALDTSGNMDAEALAVRDLVNDFTAGLAARGIDLHVALISTIAPSEEKKDANAFVYPRPWAVVRARMTRRCPDFFTCTAHRQSGRLDRNPRDRC